jgi:Holliday junction resolvase RusA-like endonuclease
MQEVGLVLDVAERAEALGDDFATWADLPQQVITGQVALKAAFLQAQKFDAHAAMAELIAYQPLAEWIGHHDHFATEATGRYATPPAIGQPWRPEHRRDLDNIAKKYQQAATTIRALIKENQS